MGIGVASSLIASVYGTMMWVDSADQVVDVELDTLT